MRTSTVFAWVPYGNRGEQIEVTATPAPRLAIHGLSPPATREATVRVEYACRALGLHPNATVHVSGHPPPWGFDVAIAVAALDAAGELGCRTVPLVCGNLGLDGTIHPVRGLYTALSSCAGRTVLVPASQAGEAALTRATALPVESLADVVRYFQGAELDAIAPRPARLERRPRIVTARTEWPLSAAVLLVGPPGSGLVLEARAAASRLAPPTDPHETLAAWSTGGILDLGWSRPGQGAGELSVPLRAPHHSVSDAGLVGSRGRPGEVSLAHGGCLLLDEVHEFRRSALEALAYAVRQGEAVTGGLGMGGRGAGAAAPRFAATPQIIIGTCPPEHAERARKLYPWTGEVELARLTVDQMLDGHFASE
jgi:magnesium chelatase family protein